MQARRDEGASMEAWNVMKKRIAIIASITCTLLVTTLVTINITGEIPTIFSLIQFVSFLIFFKEIASRIYYREYKRISSKRIEKSA